MVLAGGFTHENSFHWIQSLTYNSKQYTTVLSMARPPKSLIVNYCGEVGNLEIMLKVEVSLNRSQIYFAESSAGVEP